MFSQAKILVDRITKLFLDYLNVQAVYWPWMGSICLCRRWSHCRAQLDGLCYPSFIPLMGSTFSLQGFFLCHTLDEYWLFWLSLRGPVYGSVHQCSYFIVFRFVCFPVPSLFFYVIDIFSSGFWSSVSSDDCQVNQLKQKLKLTVLASRASGTSENYLRAFNR